MVAYIDQLGKVEITNAQANRIWHNSPKTYSTGLFSCHLTINSRLKIQRFITQMGYDLLKEQQKMQIVRDRNQLTINLQH
jgi:hypothetical protein